MARDYTPLNVTQAAQQRIFAGLGWDPNTKAGLSDKIGEMIGGKKTYHDLDLLCFVYDESKNPVARIGSKSEHSLEDIGQIYHSGDNTEGLGDDDDEQISAELKNLPPRLHYIVFAVAIRSGHSFKDLLSPEIRLADGYSDHNFLRYSLNGAEGADFSAFVFAAIRRGKNGGWEFKDIGAYCDEPPENDWEQALAAYL